MLVCNISLYKVQSRSCFLLRDSSGIMHTQTLHLIF